MAKRKKKKNKKNRKKNIKKNEELLKEKRIERLEELTSKLHIKQSHIVERKINKVIQGDIADVDFLLNIYNELEEISHYNPDLAAYFYDILYSHFMENSYQEEMPIKTRSL